MLKIIIHYVRTGYTFAVVWWNRAYLPRDFACRLRGLARCNAQRCWVFPEMPRAIILGWPK